MVSCITLISDFGLRDTSVAVVKGMLMQYTPAPIVDISHDVTPFLTGQAAYLLGSAHGSFPKETIHLILCDVFAQPDIRLILSESDGHYFLSADNGIVVTALGKSLLSWQYSTDSPFVTFNDWLLAACNLIGQLQSRAASELDLRNFTLSRDPGPESFQMQDTLECAVVHIDHYENVVLSITRTEFEKARNAGNFRLQFAMVEEIEELSESYHDVREGYKLCRFNSNHHLEICVNRGRAASLFGLRAGSKHNNIKILFE